MKKRALAICMAIFMGAACLSGCGEEAVNQGGVTVAQVEAGESLQSAGEYKSVTAQIDEDGFFDLVFVTSSMDGGYKENIVEIDGVQYDTIVTEGKELQDSLYRRVYLSKGNHEIGLRSYWGYINWDSLKILTSPDLPNDMYKVSAKLVNPNADDNAKRVMSYLTDIYGDYILSGQYSDGGYGSWEFFKVRAESGNNTPAVVGLEMGHCCKTAENNKFTHPSVDAAIDTWEEGGIVTMCYHWLAPEKYIKDIWWNGFRTEAVDIPLEKIMNGEDEEGMQLLLDDIEILAGELQKLEDAGVPVIWRPLHEASGGWFWWGAYGPETYKKLYILMYDQLTNVYGLDNLIWLWNGQDKEWYPGDEYVDIIGTDIYPGEHQYSSHANSFMELYSWLGDTNKMIVMSENGTMPDIDQCVRDGAMWGFFCTWSGEFVINDGVKVEYSEKYTDKAMLNAIYNHEKVLNLEDLPDLKKYKIHK